MRPVETPTPADALAITGALRTHGRMDGRRLAERIEALCRADQSITVRRVAAPTRHDAATFAVRIPYPVKRRLAQDDARRD